MLCIPLSHAPAMTIQTATERCCFFPEQPTQQASQCRQSPSSQWYVFLEWSQKTRGGKNRRGILRGLGDAVGSQGCCGDLGMLRGLQDAVVCCGVCRMLRDDQYPREAVGSQRCCKMSVVGCSGAVGFPGPQGYCGSPAMLRDPSDPGSPWGAAEVSTTAQGTAPGWFWGPPRGKTRSPRPAEPPARWGSA